jgi:hypothetical protein
VPAPADLVRWAARLLSVGAALFVLAFAFGEEARRGAFDARSGTMMLFLVTGLAANLAAWRWEAAGGGVALAALAGIAAVQLATSTRLPGIWFFLLLGVPALLHVASAGLRSPAGV